jgi:hypothetical protein
MEETLQTPATEAVVVDRDKVQEVLNMLRPYLQGRWFDSHSLIPFTIVSLVTWWPVRPLPLRDVLKSIMSAGRHKAPPLKGSVCAPPS